MSGCRDNAGVDLAWDTMDESFWGNHKREISRIVKLGGKVITFGWNSGGIGYKYGFQIKRILLVPHGGWHNDTICTVEIKTHQGEIEKSRGFEEKMTVKGTAGAAPETDKRLIEALEALPEGYWDFKDSDVREYTHGIHNYPAMMVCPISRNIIRIMESIKQVHTLFDPFAGSGTVLVEGMLANIDNVYGNDINPLALFLSKVKTTRLDTERLQGESIELFDRISKLYQQYKLQIDGADSVMRNTYGLDLTGKKGWGDRAPDYLRKYIVDANVP